MAASGSAVGPDEVIADDRMEMRVSVVIPVYARQDDGVRAVRSALAQGDSVFEVVIIDDASPEAFKLPHDIAADRRVRLVRHAENRGESGARNTGFAEVRGNWIAFLDSDDYWLPGKLERQIAFAREDQSRAPDPLVCYVTGFVYARQAAGTLKALLPREATSALDLASACWFAPGSTALFNVGVPQAIGPCDTQLRRLQDYEWFLRLGLAGGRVRVAPFLGSVIEVGGRPSQAAIEAACCAIEAKWLRSSERRPSPEICRRISATMALERASAAYHAGNKIDLMRHMLRSIVLKPRLHPYVERWWTEVEVPPAISIRPPA